MLYYMHNNNVMMLEQLLALVRYNSVFVPLCSPKTCKDVFNPNVTTFQSNCAEGLHFSAFHYDSLEKATELFMLHSKGS